MKKSGFVVVVVGMLATSAFALSSFVTTTRFSTAASVCADGTAQDVSCLESQGAVAFDGTIDDALAAELRSSGTCPCSDGGGTAQAGTIPSTSSSGQVDAFVNGLASNGWGYASIVASTYDKNGKQISRKTFVLGKGKGFATLRSGLKAFFADAIKAGAGNYKVVTGKPRI